MSQPTVHDLVLRGGRVIDPETGTDETADVGVTDGVITALGGGSLAGRLVLDVSGEVVCPGFIDLHSHAQGVAEHRLQALDGVTTALELEVGAHPVAAAYARAAAEGRPINYGFSAAWGLARMAVLTGAPRAGAVEEFFRHLADARWQRPASPSEVVAILAEIESDLVAGALGIGVVVGYAPETAVEEYLAVAAAAAAAGVPTYTHSRDLVEMDPATPVDGAVEIVRAAAETGARMHYCHVNSTSARHLERVLSLVGRAKAEGAPVSVEAYPYGTGMTAVGAHFLAPERLARRGMTPSSIRSLRTGRTMADAVELAEFRRQEPEALVFTEFLREDEPSELALLEEVLRRPETIVASDAIPLAWLAGRPADPLAWPLPADAVTHPRTAGCFARMLRLCRERRLLSLPEAVSRCTLLPARLLEEAAPGFRRKGRLQVGCDADLVVFDAEAVREEATYTATTRPPSGISHVLVGGAFVVREAEIVTGAMPGRPLLAGTG